MFLFPFLFFVFLRCCRQLYDILMVNEWQKCKKSHLLLRLSSTQKIWAEMPINEIVNHVKIDNWNNSCVWIHRNVVIMQILRLVYFYPQLTFGSKTIGCKNCCISSFCEHFSWLPSLNDCILKHYEWFVCCVGGHVNGIVGHIWNCVFSFWVSERSFHENKTTFNFPQCRVSQLWRISLSPMTSLSPNNLRDPLALLQTREATWTRS